MELGYIGLFLASFLAATILPLSSEVVLTFLLLNRFDPAATITVATAGNVLGAFCNYAIGFWGGIALVKKFLKISEDEYHKAAKRFETYGVFSLLMAWAPVIGDPLTVVAGMLKINVLLFFTLVTAGKALRYILLGYAVLA